ncbi:class I SAM-dependent methyltransferase [Candidatus Bathyarchaeota archaeon]|nr:MAG: class I SAM-dependent methyltransferase [Candidatus Bathyarchaeota archaeon]
MASSGTNGTYSKDLGDPLAYFPRKYWDSGADRWDETVANKSFPHYFYYYEADLYINDLLENSRLSLELGAGTCGSTISHASPDKKIIATDYSPKMLQLGRERLRVARLLGQVDLVVADQCHLPFRDDCFDSVFSRGVALSYATDPQRFLKEANRVLERNGRLGIDFMNALVARKTKRKIHRVDRINGAFYYVEMFNEDGKQKRIGYRLPDDLKPPDESLRGPFFGGYESKLESLKLESLPREEWWAVFYTPTEAKGLARDAGFKGIKLYPLGCFTRGLQKQSLVAFLQENRDSLSRLQKEMAGIFKMDSAVHIFMTAEKP